MVPELARVEVLAPAPSPLDPRRADDHRGEGVVGELPFVLDRRLHLGLLGGFRVERPQGVAMVTNWHRNSAKTLLKLLAISSRHALHREQVMDILWPDSGFKSALNNLAKALHAARHTLEPDLPLRASSAYLRTSDEMVALDPERVVVDADRFERLAEDAFRRRDLTSFELALGSYRGELLPEDRYEDWCVERRGYLAELRTRLLIGLADAQEGRGDMEEAASTLDEVLRQDPTREAVHRQLMRLYAELGRPAQGVRQFHRCEEALRRELGLEPGGDTIALYHDLMTRRLQRRAPAAEHQVEPPSVGQAEVLPNPARDQPFVGREQLLQLLYGQLDRRARDASGMILLAGEAGVGKTRLLEELATEARRRGVAVLWGGVGPHAGSFFYGPIAVGLENFAAGRSDVERGILAQRYPVLARIVPSLGGTRGPLREGAGGDPQIADLVTATVQLLTELGRRQPVLIVMGDLEEADPVSIDLVPYLRQLALDRRWLLAATVRSGRTPSGAGLQRRVEVADRDRSCLTIEVPCLSREQCDKLALALLGCEVGDQILGQIYRQSGGNPMFVQELVKQIRSNRDAVAALVDASGELPVLGVPARVRALVTASLSLMDPGLRRVLELMAAAGSDGVSLTDLRAAAGALEPPLSYPALLDALDLALAAQLLEERDGGYGFRHLFMRSTLYEGLSHHRLDQLLSAFRAGRAGWSAPTR